MNNEFFEALQMLEREKGIKADYLIEKITNAIVIAVKKDYEVADNVTVVIDPDNGRFSVSITRCWICSCSRVSCSALRWSSKSFSAMARTSSSIMIA